MTSRSLNFKLQDKNGKAFTLDSFKGMKKVVYFYPKDDTPGCTVETKGFDTYLPKFIAKKTAVIGISGGDNKSKAKFCKKHKFRLPLLSDPTNKVAKAYGAFGEKVFMGRKYKGILRNTYILDEKNKLVKSFENVTPATHPEEVLKFLGTPTPTIVKAKEAAPPKKAAPLKAAAKKKPVKKAVKKKTPKKAAKKVVSKKQAASRKTKKTLRKK
jgi:peroxiredoxin Q/BCP